MTRKLPIAKLFDPSQYLDQIFQHEVGDGAVDIAIEFDPATAPYIRERKWHPSQKLIEHPDESVTLTMTVSGLNDIKRCVELWQGGEGFESTKADGNG